MSGRRHPVTPERAALEAEVLASYGVETQSRTAARLGISKGTVSGLHRDAIAAGKLQPMGDHGRQRMFSGAMAARQAMQGGRASA